MRIEYIDYGLERTAESQALSKVEDSSNVEAKMKDGVLSLTLQKLTHDKESTSIPIMDGA
jgi:HSP20 family molecular chaperone IbpA